MTQATDDESAIAEALRVRLADVLSRACYGGEDVRVRNLRSPGVGASSDVVLFTAEVGGRDEKLVMRRQRDGLPIYPDTDLVREFKVLQAVWRDSAVPVPEPLLVDSDPALMGSPFLLMREVSGRTPEHVPAMAGTTAGKPSYNASGWLADAPEDARRAVWRNALETMARIERVDVATLAFLRDPQEANGVASQVRRWADYADWAEILPNRTIEDARAWLLANVPADAPTRLAWGDARIGNMIFEDRRCKAVIDWESPSLGGGEMDLGWWLVMDEWHGSAMGLQRLPGLGDREETIALWEEFAGRPANAIRFHELFAVYRNVCIVERVIAIARRTAPDAPPRANPLLPVLARHLASV